MCAALVVANVEVVSALLCYSCGSCEDPVKTINITCQKACKTLEYTNYSMFADCSPDGSWVSGSNGSKFSMGHHHTGHAWAVA